MLPTVVLPDWVPRISKVVVQKASFLRAMSLGLYDLSGAKEADSFGMSDDADEQARQGQLPRCRALSPPSRPTHGGSHMTKNNDSVSARVVITNSEEEPRPAGIKSCTPLSASGRRKAFGLPRTTNNIW
jgi:hypothetical protein